MEAIVLNKAFINTLQFRRGGRNKWVDWQISAQMINGEDAITRRLAKISKLINGEIGINGEAGKNTAIRNFIATKSSNNLCWLKLCCCCDTDYNIIDHLVSSEPHLF